MTSACGRGMQGWRNAPAPCDPDPTEIAIENAYAALAVIDDLHDMPGWISFTGVNSGQ